MIKYGVDEFLSIERYPLPMECPECEKTMRPVHKHRLPDLPQYYFCTFCDAMIPENHPSIRFRKPTTNADRIRAMTDEELAEWISWNGVGNGYGNSEAEWIEWLKEEVK